MIVVLWLLPCSFGFLIYFLEVRFFNILFVLNHNFLYVYYHLYIGRTSLFSIFLRSTVSCENSALRNQLLIIHGLSIALVWAFYFKMSFIYIDYPHTMHRTVHSLGKSLVYMSTRQYLTDIVNIKRGNYYGTWLLCEGRRWYQVDFFLKFVLEGSMAKW